MIQKSCRIRENERIGKYTLQLTTLKENELVFTFLALGLLLFSAFMFGKIFEHFKAPKVVGEIVGGMIVGGSGLYHLFPEIITSIFQSYNEEGKVLNIFYQLGLIFLMLSSGYNTNLDFDKNNKKSLFLLFFGATIIPMLLALPFVTIFKSDFIGKQGNEISFTLVFTICVAITSIPVISKIFFDIGIMNTKFSNLVLTVSTFQDLCLWILLNLAIQITLDGNITITKMFLVSFTTIGIFVVIYFISNFVKSRKFKLNEKSFFSIMFVFLFFVIAFCSKLGINLMYSSFLVGFTIKMLSQNDKKINDKMEIFKEISLSCFVPIYFALVGIQLDIIHNFSIVRFVLFFILAFVLEGLGVLISLYFSKFNKKTIINLTITMNARGGLGIVLATTAYAYNIINLEFFTVIILTTMLSSCIAGYWLRLQNKTPNVYSSLYK